MFGERFVVYIYFSRSFQNNLGKIVPVSFKWQCFLRLFERSRLSFTCLRLKKPYPTLPVRLFFFYFVSFKNVFILKNYILIQGNMESTENDDTVSRLKTPLRVCSSDSIFLVFQYRSLKNKNEEKSMLNVHEKSPAIKMMQKTGMIKCSLWGMDCSNSVVLLTKAYAERLIVLNVL